jgi:hypothetical protein
VHRWTTKRGRVNYRDGALLRVNSDREREAMGRFTNEQMEELEDDTEFSVPQFAERLDAIDHIDVAAVPALPCGHHISF